MKNILVLGSGCSRCNMLHRNVESAVKELGIECEIFMVSDPAAIAGFGIMSTPALIIDGELKVAGKLPAIDRLKKILTE
jgi:small redox-active disulfide protein 2